MKTIFIILSLFGVPECAFEDSDNCFWNADSRGNGLGVSFVAWNDEIYYLNFK